MSCIEWMNECSLISSLLNKHVLLRMFKPYISHSFLARIYDWVYTIYSSFTCACILSTGRSLDCKDEQITSKKCKKCTYLKDMIFLIMYARGFQVQQ